MEDIFLPDYYVPSIYAIDYDKLSELGISNLIIDIDNTIMPWGSKEPDIKAKTLLNRLIEKGFNICLLSNSSAERVRMFKGDLKIYTYSSIGIKPMKKMFIGALKALNANRENTCVIGDQIYSDILGAKRCGIKSILVDPIDKTEFITTRLVRKIEIKIRKQLNYSKEIIKDE
ncbi:UMP phosphatase [Caloramator mitchellensis]|uniref:UMP phosphatase n=1 Tax=Caloramator mitchellensis TaxID=908809 RepID=A0A0R3JTM1_CALMK|nr:YqeG family HAD IIIA-type phosphatase [Caloramator mitchellensis]KRQ86859.1 UMP phosphatase [Caloramator mitchellensis]